MLFYLIFSRVSHTVCLVILEYHNEAVATQNPTKGNSHGKPCRLTPAYIMMGRGISIMAVKIADKIPSQPANTPTGVRSTVWIERHAGQTRTPDSISAEQIGHFMVFLQL